MKKITAELLSYREKAILGKDFGELWKFGSIRLILLGLATLFSVICPLLYLVAIMAIPEGQSANLMNIGKLLPEVYAGLTYRQGLFYILINMICPLFFILLPILSSVIVSAVFFVGEKENRTMPTLLCAACTPRSIFRAKFCCAVMNGLLISAVAFFAILVIASVGSIYFAVPFFMNFSWVIEVFLLSPALTMLGALFTYFISSKHDRILNAVMACGYVVLPFVLLFIGQFAGLYEITWIFLLITAALVLAADGICYTIALKHVTAEKLIEIGENNVY